MGKLKPPPLTHAAVRVRRVHEVPCFSVSVYVVPDRKPVIRVNQTMVGAAHDEAVGWALDFVASGQTGYLERTATPAA